MVQLPAGGDPAGLLRAVRRGPRKKLEDVARALIGKGPRTGGIHRSHGAEDAVSSADFLRDGGASAEEALETVHVLESNWDTVRVFRRCRPRWITGFHAPVYDGIEAAELHHAIVLLDIPPSDVPSLLDGVDVMVGATRQARSEEP
ncbi:DUF1799 domain-containing protein [Stenotrophomonas lactitubi]|uniref:DUF1799 domain-containing protein n=1 Tax=Stenotrophomonas lactitubi TaxID=2045214 RepID=A0AAW4GG69_9GAMM|nr:DUF1799 domain-containing protein [Stenotrophomonas lactitubi]MBM9921969.1 DUF1799 domain-containing protein [Stenotrophomonas lactitubi]MBM9936534.1 DUF1799 domain-containing protein [Stenotrophomonas lactitubi]